MDKKPKQRLSITNHFTAEPTLNSPFFGESKSKATPTQEIEIFLPPLSSQDLENLGD